MTGTSSAIARFADWLLCSAALADARAAPPLPASAQRPLERARDGASVADRLLEQAAAPGADAAIDAAAAAAGALAIYREAAYWALCALTAEPADTEPDLERAFQRAPAVRLQAAAGSAEQLAYARSTLVLNQVGVAALEERELLARVRSVRTFVARLVLELDREARVRELLRARYTRIAALAVMLAASIAIGLYLARYARPDVAPEASWRASSSEPGFAPSGRGFGAREGGPNIFFHTQTEPSPWLELDLGKVRAVRGITVDNRMDCCQDRALPLVLEASQNGQHWTEIARRETLFYTWRAWFPRQRARFLRLRVDRPSLLHLGPIEVR